jgi:hypothetical protein
MALQADDPFLQHSQHRSNNEGVRPSCGDCHIPTNNWLYPPTTKTVPWLFGIWLSHTKTRGIDRVI